MNKKEEYIKLFQGYIKICEANKGFAINNENWILDAEGLAIKFCAHCSSALYLYGGTKIPEIKIYDISFIDYASLNILSRAAFETSLIFHHLFIQPTSKEERDLRYWSWQLSGLLERQGFPIKSPQGKMQLASEKEIINSLKEKIESNIVFLGLKLKKRKEILEHGKWRDKSWFKIAQDAGLDETHAGSFYKYLCGYAHSGSLSSLQVREAQTLKIQRQMTESGMTLIMISMAKMIESFSNLFPRSKQELLRSPEICNLVDVWRGVGSSSLAEIEIDCNSLP